MKPATRALRIGDDIEFHGVNYQLSALEGDVAMLSAAGTAPVAIKIGALYSDKSFKIIDARPLHRRITGPSQLFDSLPAEVQQRARWLEGHITEALDGTPLTDESGHPPRAEYNVAHRSLRQRELAKHAELLSLGEPMGFSTFQRLRNAYELEGIIALADQRLVRRTPITGHTDQRVVDAILTVLERNTHQSTGSMDRLMRQVSKHVEEEHGPGTVAMPSRATFHRLLGKLAQGRHATGSARTRRTLAQQAPAPFSTTYPVRPGELMQIDSTPLDIAVELDDGVIGRVELTALVDIATRSIPAAVIRPMTKAVDAALLLARCITPELMRPGWPEAVSMAASALPYRSMRTIDQRLEGAAAKPVIVPENIVCDHGKAYLSNTFKAACRSLGISIQPAHPDTPTDKPVIERTLQSIGTLFAQYVTGYLGSSVDRRGKNAENNAVFSLIEIQDLLDEWIVTAWQNRPHEGLRDPFSPGRVFTPNEKYAALLSVSGYVPVPLGADEYIELMPSQTRVINSYGVKIHHRVYDSAELNPYRGQKSGARALGGQWEVRFDPYDVSRIWIRNHDDGGWITAYWRQLHSSPQPFGDDIWEHGRQIVAGRGTTSPSEETIKAAVDDLLTRASASFPTTKKTTKRDRRVVARNKATEKPGWPKPPLPGTGSPDAREPIPEPDPPDDCGRPEEPKDELAKIIPLKIYDAREEAEKWW
jgi:putative transposase